MIAAVAAAPPPAADDALSFLDAQRVVAGFSGGPSLPFVFGMSGTADPFAVYLNAACARHQRSAAPQFLPFGTLGQFIARGSAPEVAEVFVLFPWDLAPELDWRSGVPPDRVSIDEMLVRADQTAQALHQRHAHLLYVSAPTPPVTGIAADDAALRWRLDAIAAGWGAQVLPPTVFSLSGYFASGCPVAGAWLGRVAVRAVDAIVAPPAAPSKLLATDLDNTLWGGVIAEVGTDGVAFESSGAGFRHHVYQSLLLRLRREGALLAAVTRNDRDAVTPPLSSGRMILGSDDFVDVCAGYVAKSSLIRELAARLNIGLDSVVFVDDNPVEIEEVRRALPQVHALAFPPRDDALPAFLDALAGLFARDDVTPEDRERTVMYRRRGDSIAPTAAAGADLTDYLASLGMRLDMHDRSAGDRTRAVQLINKTNQFNANGRRWSNDEVGAMLRDGGRLVTASLSDRTGGHGEIIACLLDRAGVVHSFVMSCRVFQRRVEHAFIASLIKNGTTPIAFSHWPTERNEPFRQFIAEDAFAATDNGFVAFDAARWLERHASDEALFDVRWE